MVGRRDEAIQTLVRLRSLPADHPRVQIEVREIEDDVHKSTADAPSTFTAVIKETFTVASNLRRLQQVMLSYALAQLSGANSITSYFVPIMEIIANGKKSTSDSIFLSGMYPLSKGRVQHHRILLFHRRPRPAKILASWVGHTGNLSSVHWHLCQENSGRPCK